MPPQTIMATAAIAKTLVSPPIEYISRSDMVQAMSQRVYPSIRQELRWTICPHN